MLISRSCILTERGPILLLIRVLFLAAVDHQDYVPNWVISMKKNEYKAFTIMELLIVIIIVGIMVAFSIPNYNKSVTRAYEQDAVMQLSTIHAAEQIYLAKEGAYWPTGTSYPVDQINATLHTNTIENGMTYTCIPNPPGFRCTAQRFDGTFTVQIKDGVLSNINPCCSSGVCPTLAGC